MCTTLVEIGIVVLPIRIGAQHHHYNYLLVPWVNYGYLMCIVSFDHLSNSDFVMIECLSLTSCPLLNEHA